MQFQADLLQAPVVRPKIIETQPWGLHTWQVGGGLLERYSGDSAGMAS